MKTKHKVYGCIIAIIIVITIMYIYNDLHYVKYENIQNHIEKEIGHEVTIEKNLEKSQYYFFLYTYEDSEKEKQIGMSFYEKKPFSRYERIGGSLGNKVTGKYYARGGSLIYCVFGANIDNSISKVRIDLDENKYEEKILDESYYMIPFVFKNKNIEYDKITFYNSKDEDITEQIVERRMYAIE